MSGWLLFVCLSLAVQDREREDRPARPPQDRPPREEGDRPRPPRPPDSVPPGRERRPGPPFNPEELHDWMKENEPELSRRLERLQREGRRDEVQRLQQDAAIRMREMKILKERDPEGWERARAAQGLERQARETADRARRGAGADREEALRQLRELVGRLFDQREASRERELAELKRRVQEIEAAMAERKGDRARLVQQRMDELLQDEPVRRER
jgi:hypothetical protein